ncbi:hypothetical protein J3Q64DRAFT_1847124 [Phycomyces blakesleeanus]|uniref:DNA2/NAM7 helicase-like C-terminal domain-containing protein n=1 Tax=Phycomyces blakesleeanus TaxID=4837 RepID=A0ABR3B551_PHYBL
MSNSKKDSKNKPASIIYIIRVCHLDYNLQASLPEPTLRRFTISGLAKSGYYNCEKLLGLSSESTSTQSVNTNTEEANFKRGNEFEEALLNTLDKSTTTDYTDTPTAQSKHVLQTVKPGQTLYQLSFEMPDSFYEDEIMNTNVYRLRRFIPDFIQVKEDPITKERVLFIIDAKASKSVHSSHQFQVATYAYLLSYIVQDIRNLKVDYLGGVWLPSDWKEPVAFRVDLMIPKMKHFYTTELIATLQSKDPEWIYNAKCKTCTYASLCERESVGTPGEIPYMTPHMIEAAKSLIPENKNDSLEELADNLKNMSIQKSNKSIPRFDDWQRIKKSPLFEPFYKSYSEKKPIFIGNPSTIISSGIEQEIYIVFVIDPTHGRMCSYSIKFNGLDFENTLKDYCTGSVDPSAKNKSDIEAYVILAANFSTNLFNVLLKMDQIKAKFSIFFYGNETKVAIQDCLCDLLSSAPKFIKNTKYCEEIVSNAKECLLNLFVGVNLLKLPDALFPDDTHLDRVSSNRMVVLEDLLRENIALGIPGFYKLEDIAEWMCEDTKSVSKHFLQSLEKDGLYNTWVLGETKPKNSSLEREKRYHIQVYGEILEKYRYLAQEYQQQQHQHQHQQDRTSSVCIFPLVCEPFSWTRSGAIYSNRLTRLIFFKYLELLASYEKLRTERLADLCSIAKKGLSGPTNGLLLEFVEYAQSISEARQVKSLVGHFRVVEQDLDGATKIKIDSLKSNTFQEYILVSANSQGILEIISYPDLMYRAKLRNLNITTMNVKAIIENGNVVVLSGYFKPLNLVKGTRYLLYRRHIDFNTDKVIAVLKDMGKSENADSVFSQLVEDPNGWSKQPVRRDLPVDIKATALRLRDDFAMSPSQKIISASTLQNRLQIVWGPPGSGKTEFLALFVNWYIAHIFGSCPETRPLVIGVTAFTRHAISNLLSRIASVQSRQGILAKFQIVSLGTVMGENMIHTKADRLPALIRSLHSKNMMAATATATAVVVGGTVWDWAKVKKNWPEWAGCDMMIIDESSQLLVSDSALVINCLNESNGRLIIAGDHMQLGPILQNEYPQMALSEPCLFGSIQQCLMRTVDNQAIPTQNFRLQKGVSNDFGPNTIQLKDNWRMNEELNEFFKQIYGNDFTARYPELTLRHDWSKFITPTIGRSQELKAILDPKHALTMTRLLFNHTNTSAANIEIETEAEVVAQIVKTHLMTRVEASRSQTPISKTKHSPLHVTTTPAPAVLVMVVTPHHRQRVAIQRALGDTQGTVVVDTVEKMQGQECELVIACFTYLTITKSKLDFLLDFKRWNVAVSRARCKIIIVTTDNVLQLPTHKDNSGLDVFKSHTSAEGWGFVCLLRDWAEKEESVVRWHV